MRDRHVVPNRYAAGGVNVAGGMDADPGPNLQLFDAKQNALAVHINQISAGPSDRTKRTQANEP
ncbi:hypothetical protein GCM10025863_18380 [Microbacterium suwonense]|uniref:Uncharacterized protein n=1 Tax=Microbacterium suwonense TaxID=683047 RepID=A0ABM8FUQ5_9MICO|nr:hypothetical protein GCM10025863_18380 [Microbacterium suwonense]